MTAITTAVSGLLASAAQLTATASNVANIQSVGALPQHGSPFGPAVRIGAPATPPDGGGPGAGGRPNAPQPYQPLTAVQTTAPGGGVTTEIATRAASVVPAYSPQSPYANSQGLVGAPKVDLAQASADQLSALASFQANIATLKAAEETQKTVLAIG